VSPAGYYSGPTDPPHNRAPLNDVKHTLDGYDGAVKEELQAFINKYKISKNNPMSGKQMKTFAEAMREGKTYTGKAENAAKLQKFNGEVLRRAERCGTKLPTDDQSILARGRKYRQNSGRFLALAAIGGILGLLMSGSAMAGQVNKLAASPQFVQALRAAEAGDLATVQRLLVGYGGVDAYNNRSHLFGRFAAEMEDANPLQQGGLVGLHGRLLQYFADLSRMNVRPNRGTGR
jgi:hypothetical protein